MTVDSDRSSPAPPQTKKASELDLHWQQAHSQSRMGNQIRRWPPWDVESSKRQLDDLCSIVRDPRASGVDGEPLGWISRLLVVRCCGHMEQVISKCASGYIEVGSWGYTRTFGLSHLERSMNPSPSAITKLLLRFSPQLADDFEVFLKEKDGRLHDDLTAMVASRNRIAHGENEGAARDRALRFYDATIEISDWIIAALNPDPSKFG